MTVPNVLPVKAAGAVLLVLPVELPVELLCPPKGVPPILEPVLEN
jgi:hypothetical protein